MQPDLVAQLREREIGPQSCARASRVLLALLRGERLWRIPILSGESTGTPTAYYVGTYGRLRTVTKVPGVDQFWLSTTNCDNNGGAANDSDIILRVTVS